MNAPQVCEVRGIEVAVDLDPFRQAALAALKGAPPAGRPDPDPVVRVYKVIRDLESGA